MRTYSDPDATALSMLDYTIPSDYALSSDCTGAPAWSSSPLGDPAVDDDEFFNLVDGYGPEEWGLKPRPFRTGIAIAAAVLGALGVGASLGIAIRDFAGPPPATPALVVPAVAAPAAPQAGSPTPVAPAPTGLPVHTAAPVAAAARPNRALPTNRVVIPSGSGVPANAPVSAPDAGPADGGTPVDAAPPPAAPLPHPSLVINIPPPPAPPFVPPKLLPPPPPVSIQIPLPAPIKLPFQQP